MSDDTDLAPGWEAIDRALEPIYGDEHPFHFGTLVRWQFGGPDPLDGLSAYRRTEPTPHWHIVSFGMSELYEKGEQSDPKVSGWGFEFTFRVARSASEKNPPVWALTFLQNLGRYVMESGSWFEPGHHMDCNGPISLEYPDTSLNAICFALDPELGEVDTPHGRLQFLQVCGITADELEAIRQWNSLSFLDAVSSDNPLLITDLERPSLLSQPSFRAIVDAGTERDGSSTGTLFIDETRWEWEPSKPRITLGAISVDAWRHTLKGRLPFGRSLELRGKDSGQTIRFSPGEPGSATIEEQTLVIELSAHEVREIVESVRPVGGTYDLGRLVVVVEPTQLTNDDGEVTEIIG